MGYQVDPNPLKNKVLAKNSNETNEFIQEKGNLFYLNFNQYMRNVEYMHLNSVKILVN